MAKYRPKSEVDLQWNRARRQITRDIDTEWQHLREGILNQALTVASEKYWTAVTAGKTLELEAEYQETMGKWIVKEVRERLPVATPSE